MGIINIIVIGLGLAMDALAVSITSGLTVRRVRIRYALKLALSFAGFQALMPVIGWLAGIRIQRKNPDGRSLGCHAAARSDRDQNDPRYRQGKR
mgnify:CR=1 FL=1